jgi:hypothetical protein
MAGKQKLSPKEIKTCENYLKGMSLKKAMEASGYSEEYCTDSGKLFKFLKRRHVCAYLRKRQEEIAAAENLDKAEIIKYIRHIIASDDPRDRVKGVELLMRLGIPQDEVTFANKGEAVKSITFNIAEK